jgi:signal transduction histidine kinase
MPKRVGNSSWSFKEAINNIARHSGCKRAEIDLAREGDGLVLRIQDDGKGLPAAATSGDGHGLLSMQARAGMLGGDIAIASEPGQGTSITLRVPSTRARTNRRETIQMDGDKHPDSF